MSTFSFPDAMKPESMMDMTGWMKQMPAMPISPLMVHPMAASAAVTALGVAATGQMLGMMMGSMQGAMEASRRMETATADALFDGAAGWWPAGTGTSESPASGRAHPRPAAPAKTAPAVREAEAAPADSTPEAEARAAGTVVDLKAAADDAAHAVIETREAPATPSEKDAASEIAPEEFKQPPEMARPEAPDDLKKISGIGPKLEQVLNGLGIWKFDQIVAWTPQEVAWLDDYLQFKGRIERDNWQAQAKTLAAA